MKNSHFAMLYVATVALLLLGSISASLAGPTPATNLMKSHVGKVTKVNQNARTFTVHWMLADRIADADKIGLTHSKEATFKATDKTTYMVGTNNNEGSWSDLKVGLRVNVKDHAQGGDRIADNVQIVSSP
jgi:hypothetical protein